MTIADKLIKVTSNFAITEKANDDSLIISGWANTTDKDRAGDVILEEAWSKGGLSDYLNNPIILGYHKHDNPIGKMTEHSVNSRGLFITAEISKSAGKIYEMIKEGILKSFSVGFKVKDADYDDVTDIFVIKDLELLEVSVVSVPANQNSIFSISKQFESVDEYGDFKKEFQPKETKEEIDKEGAVSEKDTKVPETEQVPSEETLILEEVKALIKKAVTDIEDEKSTEEVSSDIETDNSETKSTSPEQIKKEEETVMTDITVTDNTEKLLSDLEARFEDKNKSLTEALEGLHADLKEKSDEVVALQKSKMIFEEKSAIDIARADIDSAVLLGKILGVDAKSTKFAGTILEKAPSDHHSALTQDWEQQFSTNVWNDIREQLIVEPMFRNVAMQTNKMHLPINPEAGYGEWIASTAYNHTATSTGTAVEHDITDTTLTAYKLTAKEYLGYEEEEDSIIPLLPIVRDAIVRRMAKSSEQAILRGTGVSTSNPIAGITTLAKAAGGAAVTTLSLAGGDKTTATILQTVRRGLGVRGLMPADVIYIVSHAAYYDILEDPIFRTVDLVGPLATVITGQVGSVNGSPVVVSGEFDTVALGNAAAVAVNASNFIKGELRSVMMERDKNIEFQRNVLVASRRMGFIPLVANVGASVLEYVT